MLIIEITWLTALVSWLAGLLSFLSPCVLPLFPSYLSFITGMSYEALTDDERAPRRQALVFFHSLAFVLGFSVVFVALGTAAGGLGQLLFQYQGVLSVAGGVLIILFGIILLGVFEVPFLSRTTRFDLKTKPPGYVGSFAVGVTFAAAWTPCVGPILGALFTLAATKPALSRLLLVFYSLGLATPFLLASLALGRFLTLYRSYRGLIRWINAAGGVILIVFGLLLITDHVKVLSLWLIGVLPDLTGLEDYVVRLLAE